MKHIIIEGGDRVGKNTVIKGICEHFNYDNVHVRHFGKPPKKFPPYVSPYEFQKTCFWKEMNLLQHLDDMDRDEPYNYFENIVIWNRAHLGEYVYGQMFRDLDKKEITSYLLHFEEILTNPDTTLILMTFDNAEFFMDQEDGNSLSKTIDSKRRELKLFDEAFDNSIILNKRRVVVNEGSSYRPKSEVFDEVMSTILAANPST